MLKSFKEIIENVRKHRNEAKKEARTFYPTGLLESRGAWVDVVIKRASDGQNEHVFPGAEWEWRGTREDLEKARELGLQRVPGQVVEVTIYGGYDWRERRGDEDYEPDIDAGQWCSDNLEMELTLLGEIA